MLSIIFSAASASAVAVGFAALAVMDIFYVPIIMRHIKGTGRFYLVFDSLQKLMVLVATVFLAIKFSYLVPGDAKNQIIFILIFLYILNYNFDINDTFFSDIKIFKKNKNHNDEGYSNKAVELISQIESDEEREANKSVFNKGLDMIQKYIFNLNFQFGTLRSLILRDTEYIQATEDISVEWGMKEVAVKMTIKEMVQNNIYRIVSDLLVIALVSLAIF